MSEQVTAHADPDNEAPWAMQLVVRVEKQAPPARTAVVEAVASATVLALDHVENGGTDVERAAVDRWLAVRIRKVVRRARGSTWDQLEPLAVVDHHTASAHVRVFLPGPVDQVPKPVAKLQVSGLNLDDTTRTGEFPDQRVIIHLNPGLELSAGKAAAQAAHAAQLAWTNRPGPGRDAWVADGAPVAVVTSTGTRVWEQVNDRRDIRIVDAGFTEIPPNTCTCVAIVGFDA